MMCDPTNRFWRKGTPFEVMTSYTVPSSDSLLAEVFWGFPHVKPNARRSVHNPRIISLSPLSLMTDVTDTTLGASVHWLETQTGAGGTATLNKSCFDRSPWLHGQVFNLAWNILSGALCLQLEQAKPLEEHSYLFHSMGILEINIILFSL